MAVRITPCYRCPIADGCEQRNELRRRASGIGARAIEFPCPRLAAEVRPGRRVEISHPVYNEDGEPYGRAIRRMNVPATITSVSTGYRFACIVDPIDEVMAAPGGDEEANKYRFRRTMRHFRIVRFLDEPDAKFCDLGALLRDGKCDTKNGGCMCEQLTDACGSEEWRAGR